jgi:dipeptidyl aminopeptidase/acylaminoacyl peptidase
LLPVFLKIRHDYDELFPFSITMKQVILFILLASSPLIRAQKKIIDHKAYNDWKKNENQQVSRNGDIITFEVNPHRGDGWLFIYRISTGAIDSIPRGKDAVISVENDYVAFRIVPPFDTIRKLEIKKTDKAKWPKDSLGIYFIATDSLLKKPNLKSFSVGKENNWLAALWEKETQKKDEITEKKRPHKKKKKKSKEENSYKSDGKRLSVSWPGKSIEFEFEDVMDFSINETGTRLAYTVHKKIKRDSTSLWVFHLQNKEHFRVGTFTGVKHFTFDKKGDVLAFLSSQDTAKAKIYSLNILPEGERIPKLLADTNIIGAELDRSVSEHCSPIFTEDGRFLFFGVGKKPEPEKKDTVTEAEKVEIDIWHYQDKRLQSQQLVELKKDQKKVGWFVYHRDSGKVLELTSDTLETTFTAKLTGDYLCATSNQAYQHQLQWDSPGREDYYRVHIWTGEKELLRRAVAFDGLLSPSGKLFTYFHDSINQYYMLDVDRKAQTCITCSEKGVNWQTDVNGMPMLADPFGAKGYLDDERTFMIQSEYDLWTYQPEKEKLTCLTGRMGEKQRIRLDWIPWEKDSVFLSEQNAYIKGFNELTKGTHLFTIKDGNLSEIYQSPHQLLLLKRAKKAETILFRKSSVRDYPDLSFTQTDFKDESRVHQTNPQQVSYNWAKVQLVKWKNYEGVQLEGLVYTPEDFDSTKKYPLLIYYYELNSDELHTHYVPKPTASIIYPTEYASAGYVVFIPDIRYKPGHPAQSAYSCIMSGTDHVLRTFPYIDSTRMGLQGQSWGGYQTAQLITMTARYKAAMAGAPVANMFSAYGGIRWSSGWNRQFQYEKSQSRIGKTIWDAPELYVENSPLFHLPKVATPLLIMSNDKDGAVPWYQGIELFTAMKRLGKPCWMLNYNGEEHNLMENANRMDLSIRMRQFFDHYLLGAPPPVWLKEGIPAIDKGKNLGLDLAPDQER